MKICPVGAELFHATDRRTDLTKLVATFRSFAKVPKYMDNVTRTEQRTGQQSSSHVTPELRVPSLEIFSHNGA
jgi:hypothetical protein